MFKFKNLVIIVLLFTFVAGVYGQYIRPIFPKDGQMIYTDTVHFYWNQHLVDSTYHLQIAIDTTFTQLLVNTDVQGGDTVVSGFVHDNTYYWRIMPQGGTYGPILKFIYFTPRMIPNLVGWYAADSCHVDTLMCIDTLYDKLAFSVKDNKESDIYSVFESELGRVLSSYEYELINKWLENGNSEETIKEALKEAILNNVRSFKYIDKILYDWSKNGSKKRSKEDKSLEEMFEYDWLDDNE